MMTLSFGMFSISAGSITNSEFVPFAPVLSSPCANVPNSFSNAVVHISFSSGSSFSLLYLVILYTVVGWMTGLHHASRSTALSSLGLIVVAQYCAMLLSLHGMSKLYGAKYVYGGYYVGWLNLL